MADIGIAELIERSLTESAELHLQVARELKSPIAHAAQLVSDAFLSGGKLLLCGNGGSAADAQHIAAEFLGRFLVERVGWPAVALDANTSALTAIGNDYGFDRVFARQVEAFATEADVLMGISTSGESRNVEQAIAAARAVGCKTIALVGATPGRVGHGADVVIAVPSVVTPRIQESHIAVAHVICDIVERCLAARTAKEVGL